MVTFCSAESESHGGLVSASYGEDDVSRVEEADEKPSENEDSDEDSTRNSVSFHHIFFSVGFFYCQTITSTWNPIPQNYPSHFYRTFFIIIFLTRGD